MYSVVLRRTYAVPRERVFAAWTDPEIVARFLRPSDHETTDVQMDVRAGGAYRIAMVSPTEGPFVARGVYREVNAPERLVMTWCWEEDDPPREYDSLLTLEFHERDSGTELVLTHESLPSAESRERHEQGWAQIVDRLSTIL